MGRLQPSQQLDDLCLYRDVERRRRLIGDQQLRLIRHGHGDHRPLPHAARQFVRILQRSPLWVWNGDKLQHVDSPSGGGASRYRRIVNADRLGDLGADGEDRIEGRHRILEDHADAGAAHPGKLLLRSPGQLHTAKADRSPDLHARRQQAHDGKHRHALAAAGLADQAKRLARTRFQIHAPDRLKSATRRSEGHFKVANLEQRCIGIPHHWVRGSRKSRRPSPRKLNPSATERIAMPGPNAIHHW